MPLVLVDTKTGECLTDEETEALFVVWAATGQRCPVGGRYEVCIDFKREMKADQRRRGRYLGGAVPFGWRRKGAALVPIPWQQAVMRMMVRLRHDGLTLRPIADQINTEFGTRISHAGVAKILKRF